jgi:hypothetical protein
MIQFAELGSVLADPLKSSVHTAVQPDGGGGADALALVVTTAVPIRTSADEPASSARRALRLIFGDFAADGGDMAGVSFRGGGSAGVTRSRRAGRLRIEGAPWALP